MAFEYHVLYFETQRNLRQDIVFLVILRRHTAAIVVRKRDVKMQLPGDLSLQLGYTIYDIVVEIEHRRLDEGVMHQKQVIGQPLFDLGPKRQTVIVVGKRRGVGEIDPIVNESQTDGIVIHRRLDKKLVLEPDQSTQLHVITLVFVREHLASQKRRILSVLIQVHLDAAIDLEIRLLPMIDRIVPVDERTVKDSIMEVERDHTVVAGDGTVLAEVAVVDITRVKRGAKAKIIMPFLLCVYVQRTNYQQNK